MTDARHQFDLFGETNAHLPSPRRPQGKMQSTTQVEMAGFDLEAAALRLEDSGDFRVLRRLVPRQATARELSAFPRLGVLIDTETTGLNHQLDEVIEIGVVAFTFSEDGDIGDVVGVFNGLRQPSLPIPPEITRLTGISDEMVAGQEIDVAALDDIIRPADLVIAHNAAFDRPFCERLSTAFVPKAWACSVVEVPWAEFGFEGSKLGYLVGQAGYFHDGHRATDDCHALLAVLASRARDHGERPFQALLRSSKQRRVRIFAENSPFDMKDHLKARGYRWSDGSDGRPKAWWIELHESTYDDELRYLRAEIYRWDEAEPLTVWLDATERYRR